VARRLNAAFLVLWASTAAASPRALVADPDVALRAAISDALRPWHIDVIIDEAAPGDVSEADRRAIDRDVRYVIWRDGADLVVLDHAMEHLERRSASAGALAPLTAAAAALSVKTMLRLPPLAPPPVATPSSPTAPGSPDEGIELRIGALTGARFEYGLDGNVALRFGGTIGLRPWRDRDWRFAVIGDGGASATVDQAGFHGHWSNWSLLVGASWDHRIGDAWELGPWLAAGLEHSSLTGNEDHLVRREEALLAAVRGGLAIRRRFGDVSMGAVLAIETLVTGQTYIKTSSPAQVFEIPPIGAVLSLELAADLVP
jgi:hypothetical protein